MGVSESLSRAHSELFNFVSEHARTGKPFPAESASMFDVPPHVLHAAFSQTRVHDLIISPPADTAERLQKAETRMLRLHGLSKLSLCWLMQGRLTRGTRAARPSCNWFLTTARRAWHQLLGELNETTARRLRQVIQVLMTPYKVRQQMQSRFAIAFSAAGRTTVIPDEPIALHRLRTQWVYFEPNNLGELRPKVAEGHLKFMYDSWTLEPAPNRQYELSLLPAYKTARHDQLRDDQVATIENGLACHEALELASVTGQNILTAPRMPDAYVVANDPINYGNGALDLSEPSTAFEVTLIDHFNKWWKLDKDPQRIREALGADYADRAYPFLWLDLLEEEKTNLRCPATSWEAAKMQLGAQAESFAWGVWLASWRKFGARNILPIALMPQSVGDPFKGAEAFVSLPPAMRGRNNYANGNLNIDFQASQPQVVEIAQEPAQTVAPAAVTA